MLDVATKKKIDNARDILVGKVPDPKSQVEQITIALIYKFMDDMDVESVEMGGKAVFFTGVYAKYAWTKLFDAKLGSYAMLQLYSEALEKLPLHSGKNFPQLFRDIFKNAHLPYKDPETLKLFLKEINGFNYDHSERLGDAFEYLLSVLGSQGEAGQFRTPRHIIDFIVSILQPKKNETICDPACGTSGFLISSYKYILEQNKKKVSGDLLTPDERKALVKNIKGYDISPDMVRLSLANMYLHNFSNPQISEYDALTSDDKWNETFDIILANPPFMTPKGGIKPHKRFSIESNRSEVLFVDYIAEHINPATGRAGVIVPEGIVFQSGSHYKALRKMLIESNYLFAVVSLPAGVFNPYSNVKTSILFLDKRIAKKSNDILFIAVENDGYDLGAQRRVITKNDLPEVRDTLLQYIESHLTTKLKKADNVREKVIAVDKSIIIENDYILSIERYRGTAEKFNNKYQTKRLVDLCEINPELINPTEEFKNQHIVYVDIASVENGTGKYSLDNNIPAADAPSRARRKVVKGDILMSTVRPNLKAFAMLGDIPFNTIASTGFAVLRFANVVTGKFVLEMLFSEYVGKQIEARMGKGSYPSINQADVENLKIPVPPIAVQAEFVDKISDWKKMIDGAVQIVENYTPQLIIEPSWPLVRLGDIIHELETGVSVNSENVEATANEFGILKTSAVTYGVFKPEENKKIIRSELKRARCHPKKNSIVISRMNTENLVGASVYIEEDYPNLFLPDRLWQARITRNDVLAKYVHFVISNANYRSKISAICSGTSGSMKNISKQNFLKLEIPLPPISVQASVVSQIEREQRLVQNNIELIQIFKLKIKDEINKLWHFDGIEDYVPAMSKQLVYA